MRAKQQKTVAINRGLFLVRYATAEDQARPPKIRLSPDPASAKDISFLLHPDHNEAVLWQPETCLVGRASVPGKLEVEVLPIEEGGSAAATVRIEHLSQGKATPEDVPRDLLSGHADFCLLGHVSGRGDVVVDANEWVAGPTAPSRIEGIAIDWPNKPSNLDIQYSVKTAKPQPGSGRKTEVGSFAGTRGKAMPVVGLMFELSGSGAADLQLTVEAIFLGAPAARITGKRIIASGPTGREPLVGLRLALDSIVEAPQPQAKTAGSKSGQSAGRVRVFRSRSRSDRPPAV